MNHVSKMCYIQALSLNCKFQAGFNALMVLSASGCVIDNTIHRNTLSTLVERSGINTLAKQVCK